ncbi:MAG: InlB B-repeat-containing protein, partial [Paludibacteraceae bacterium]|nr:InlB B-repeat-containing protein [Paludibacteraceae bacterium]
MKTKFMMILALLLTMVQGIWAQTPMTKTGDNTWTAPMPAYNIQLHADYWGEFAISYELNGGVNHADNPAMYYEDEQVTLKAPLKEDYIFLGWTGSNGETPQEQVTIAQGSTGDKNYIANWQLDEEKVKLRLLTELYDALGDDVWTGYGANTGVISYSRGDEPNSFKATFMGGTYSFDLPFEAFTSVSKTANEDGSHTYTLVVNLPAQTGLSSETLHVTLNANGEITDMD